MVRYFWNILIAIDQLANTIFGGDPDETISSRCGKWHRLGKHKKGWRKKFYYFASPIVNFFEEDHFAKSIEEDEGKNEVLK